MGLAERRAATNFKDNEFPALQQEINAAAGFDVPLEVKWDSLTQDGYTDQYNESATKLFFRPLIDALKAITVDDLGKDSLKASLKKIIISNEHDNISGNGFKFQNGELVIDHKFTNVQETEARTKAIQKLLEKNL